MVTSTLIDDDTCHRLFCWLILMFFLKTRPVKTAFSCLMCPACKLVSVQFILKHFIRDAKPIVPITTARMHHVVVSHIYFACVPFAGP